MAAKQRSAPFTVCGVAVISKHHRVSSAYRPKLVTVHVREHEFFRRDGDDLRITVPVTFPEAALGATIEVPTLERPVKVKVPAGSQCGRVLRLKGRGVERGTTTGDLLVELRVTVPTTLNDDARAAVEALQSATAGDDPRRELARKAAW